MCEIISFINLFYLYFWSGNEQPKKEQQIKSRWWTHAKLSLCVNVLFLFLMYL